MPEEIQSKLIEEELKENYVDYAMSVIVGRALPDVHDGLKPVHRRILYTMYELGLMHNKPFKKSANVIGTCLAKYHPHGDMAVYDALVRMAQDFSLRYPLVNGQGNFGSIDGDSPAAYRYCITGDSLIFTNGDGIQEIGKISDKIEDDINIKIISYDGSINNVSKFFNSGKHKTMKITTRCDYSIEGSYNHPILTWDVDENYKPIIKWKLLKDLKENDIAIINRNYSLFSKIPLDLKRYYPTHGFKNDVKLPETMNDDLAFLLGALVSEGSFHNNQIVFNNKDEEFYNKVKSIILDQFKRIQLYERKIKGNCKELSIYEQKVVIFLKNIGLNNTKSDGKEIPFSVLMSTKDNIRNFLIALFEGDGSVFMQERPNKGGKTLHLCYDSKSKKLINQLKIVLLNFGIISNHPSLDKRHNCYKLYISCHDNIFRFYNELGFYSNKKKNRLELIKTINSTRFSKNDSIPFLNYYLRRKYKKEFIIKNNFDRYNSLNKNYNKLVSIIDENDKKLIDYIIKNRYFFDKITKIERSQEEKEVYSIRVDSNCHSFVANGFINHNTEARLSKIAEEMLVDIDKNTVNFIPNFDNSLKEPIVLPSKFPNLLVNGSSGIAVGMATSIPPHNLGEVIDGIIDTIENPDLAVEEIMKHIKGPDFPTGAYISGRSGINSAYKIGRGLIRLKAKTNFEEKNDRKRIIVTEIPYQVNKAMLIEQIADLVSEKKVDGIHDLRDESDRKGMRIVIELKNNANPQVVLNQLMNHTQLHETFGVTMLALVAGQPKIMNLKEVINYYITHRKRIITRRTKFDLDNAEKRAHILSGLKIALNNIDAVVKTIKSSQNVDIARNLLIQRFKLSKEQSQAILEMRLQRLTSLETAKLKKEYDDLVKLIAELKSILASESKILGIIKKDLLELKEKYGDERRTEILEQEEDFEKEDLIKKEDVVVTITSSGYIKRLPMETYKQQKRGGKGKIATTMKEKDFVEDIFVTSTHNYLLFFTDKGRVYWLKAYDIPEASRYAKGTAVINLLNVKDEKVTSFIAIKQFTEHEYLVMCTKKGIVKKTPLSAYSNPRREGIIGLGLQPKDELVAVKLTDGKQQMIIGTKNGLAIKFNEKVVRSMGRNAVGVRGIKLFKNDEVIGMEIGRDDATLLTVTENGYGKRSEISEYRLTNRGGKGVFNIKTSDRNGKVIGIKTVADDHELMFISKSGVAIRVIVKDISVIGRNTQGVRLMKLDDKDKVVSVARIISENNNIK